MNIKPIASLVFASSIAALVVACSAAPGTEESASSSEAVIGGPACLGTTQDFYWSAGSQNGLSWVRTTTWTPDNHYVAYAAEDPSGNTYVLWVQSNQLDLFSSYNTVCSLSGGGSSAGSSDPKGSCKSKCLAAPAPPGPSICLPTDFWDQGIFGCTAPSTGGTGTTGTPSGGGGGGSTGWNTGNPRIHSIY